MRILFLHHKIQAFYIALVMFLPITFLLFNSINLFKIEFKNETSFALAMKQFVEASPTPPKNVIKQEAIKPITKPIEKKKTKETIKKEEVKKIVENPPILPKEALKQEVEKVVQTPPTPSQQLTQQVAQNPNPKTMQVLNYGKDNHPLLGEMRSAIEAVKEYPRQARRMRIQGVVMIEFLWKEEQSLAYAKVIKSSGYKILDENALATIKKAALNFPASKSDLKITMPIAYTL